MSGLQQAAQSPSQFPIYLESMKFSPATRAGTVVANLLSAQRQWLLTTGPRSGRAKSVTAPRNGNHRDHAARLVTTDETAIGSWRAKWLHYDKSHFTAKAASASRRPRRIPWRRWPRWGTA